MHLLHLPKLVLQYPSESNDYEKNILEKVHLLDVVYRKPPIKKSDYPTRKRFPKLD